MATDQVSDALQVRLQVLVLYNHRRLFLSRGPPKHHLLLKVFDHSTGYCHFPPHWPKSVYHFSPWHTIHTGKLCIQSSPPRIQATVHIYNTMINNLGRSSIVLPEQICLKEDDARLSLVAREDGVNII
ncbi:hypothetical protein DVH24_040304 [Malus domestica]|uniref:Uncharacterized protein n=1 Tax=Malus domestica TaxID=3750 RepID=A0A498IAY8_MALDO|nr:hypothetical protein DVH24_040304 [Malus domestica]